ncbi:hypothetical protein HID58_084808 [Brassica napus]|uniref:Uncharacterized protein n=1 Tax=Brassica napus TaxID=3708 RepID=A0ABQ7XKS5_BRANA|nr:hypothetical protein HID58_084808 [Brassica napus]
MSVDLSRLSLLYSPRLSYSSHTAAKKGDVRCAMKSYRLSELSFSQVENLKSRPRIDFASIFTTVNPIIDAVRSKGDVAVKEYVTHSLLLDDSMF